MFKTIRNKYYKICHYMYMKLAVRFARKSVESLLNGHYNMADACIIMANGLFDISEEAKMEIQ